MGFVAENKRMCQLAAITLVLWVTHAVHPMRWLQPPAVLHTMGVQLWIFMWLCQKSELAWELWLGLYAIVTLGFFLHEIWLAAVLALSWASLEFREHVTMCVVYTFIAQCSLLLLQGREWRVARLPKPARQALGKAKVSGATMASSMRANASQHLLACDMNV